MGGHEIIEQWIGERWGQEKERQGRRDGSAANTT